MKLAIKRNKKPDSILLAILIFLVLGGFFIFLSASLGLLARGTVSFASIVFNQFLFGIVLGSALAFFASLIRHKFWRKISLPFFVFAIMATFAVFLPGIGMSHNGASRWLDLKFVTFQPVELLKLSTVIFSAHILSKYARKINIHKYFGLVLFLCIAFPIVVPLVLQPDTGSLAVILITLGAMFFVAGLRWRDVFFLFAMGVILSTILILWKPYILDRIVIFLNPMSDMQGAGYQIRQSLITVGLGGIWGRGFGQSVQKFNYLPEPIGDSIFAVYAEEFGFVGSVILLLAFAVLFYRGYYISARSPDMFGALIVVGIITLIVSQSLFNIAAMIGVVPLSGLPLIFVSHGGTALAMALFGMGIVFGVSRYRK